MFHAKQFFLSNVESFEHRLHVYSTHAEDQGTNLHGIATYTQKEREISLITFIHVRESRPGCFCNACASIQSRASFGNLSRELNASDERNVTNESQSVSRRVWIKALCVAYG